MPEKMHKFSPTGLSVFNSCPRCFWLEKNASIKRPRGIFPSLPSGMDGVIKTYYDSHRAQGTLPPELAAAVNPAMVKLYPDLTKLKKMRNWRSGLKYEGAGYTLGGAIDDLLEGVGEHVGTFSPYDYKTKGSEPKDADSVLYYQTQLDCYALLLSKNGYSMNGVGYLAYYYPRSMGDNGAGLFDTKITLMEVSAKRAEDVCQAAVVCLNGPVPDPISMCEYCDHHKALGVYEVVAKPLSMLTIQNEGVQLELPL